MGDRFYEEQNAFFAAKRAREKEDEAIDRECGRVTLFDLFGEDGLKRISESVARVIEKTERERS